MKKLSLLLSLCTMLVILFFLQVYGKENDDNFSIFYDKIKNDSTIKDYHRNNICVNDSTNIIANIHFLSTETVIDLYNLDRRADVYYKKYDTISTYQKHKDSLFQSVPILGIIKEDSNNCKFPMEMERFDDSIYIVRIVITDYLEYNFIAKIIEDEIVYYKGGITNISLFKVKE
ncbi:hypothetical protein OAQ99_06820 [Candidatus Kapabacteria bacterium]|nr:hypothetical protein [Candidatus Kapabacteria bacterium]